MLFNEFGKVRFAFCGVKQNNLMCIVFFYLCLFLFVFFFLIVVGCLCPEDHHEV